MDDAGKSSTNMNQQLNFPLLNPNFAVSRQFQQFTQPFNSSSNGGDSGKRVGIPPSHPDPIPHISPYSHTIPTTARQPSSKNFNAGPTHSRSLSQPSPLFSFDSMPPFRDSPSPLTTMSNHGMAMDNRETGGFNSSLLHPSSLTRYNNLGSNSSILAAGESLPPRKTHRRCNSDTPFGLNSMMFHNSTSLARPSPLEKLISVGSGADQSITGSRVKRETTYEREGVEERNTKRDGEDDKVSSYLNIDNVDGLNSPVAEDSKNGNGRASSDDTGDSSVHETGGDLQKKKTTPQAGKSEGLKKRAAAGGDMAPKSRHYRSVSMDSCFMGELNLSDEFPKLPPLPGKDSPSNSADGYSNDSLEVGNGCEFTDAEMKKIMADEKLIEIATIDPKRVKRILANRVSAARSKERKTRYIGELEHKVHTLQTETTTLSAQLTLLQRDSVGLKNKNTEMKYRLQAMEQQAQLRDALNEALSVEVQRLRLETGELSHGYSSGSHNLDIFQQLNLSQFQHEPQHMPHQSHCP